MPTAALRDPDITDEDRQDLQRKHLSGQNGRQGFGYEVQAASIYLVDLATKVRSRTINAESSWVAAQLPSFIDDFVVCIDGRVLFFYEIKSGEAHWGSGPKSISGNFARQQGVDQRKRRLACYRLVLGDPARYAALLRSRIKGVDVIFLPKSWSPSDFGRELIQELLSLLPSNRAEALWTQMGKNRAHFLAFDHNDASTLLSAFHAAYLRLPSGVPKSMDEYLADLSSSSDGLFRHLRSSLTPNTREILADIRGLEFVDCDGTLFYSLYEGIVFRAPFVVGARSGNFFESLVTKFRPVTVDEFLEIIEEVEGYQ